MYHCFCCVASTIDLGARSETREEEVDGLVEQDVAAPQEEGEDDRGHDHDGGRADHLVLGRPGDLLHLSLGIAEEFFDLCPCCLDSGPPVVPLRQEVKRAE